MNAPSLGLPASYGFLSQNWIMQFNFFSHFFQFPLHLEFLFLSSLSHLPITTFTPGFLFPCPSTIQGLDIWK